MRKSGWAAVTGLGSLVLLLAACGGSSSSSSPAGAASSTVTQGTASSSSASSTSTSSSPASTANAKPTSSGSSAGNTAQAQPSSAVGILPTGTTVLIVQHSDLGWVMAEANGQVVYTYAKDAKGGTPTCTGSCAAVFAPATGKPKASSAVNIPGTFGLVTGTGGVKQITYDGYPLYLYRGAAPLSTKGNGLGGVWHVVILSASDVGG